VIAESRQDGGIVVGKVSFEPLDVEEGLDAATLTARDEKCRLLSFRMDSKADVNHSSIERVSTQSIRYIKWTHVFTGTVA